MPIQTKPIAKTLFDSLQGALLAEWVYDTQGDNDLPISKPESLSEGGLKDWSSNLKAHESAFRTASKAFSQGETKTEKIGNALQAFKRHSGKSGFYGIAAHPGFAAAARSILSQVLDIVRIYQGQKKIIVIGHSLGGAIAVLLAVAIARYSLGAELGSRSCSLYTYGQPRVSRRRQLNLALRGVEYLRIQNGADIVARIPKVGYSHAGTNIYLRRKAAQGASSVERYISIDPNFLVKFMDRASAGRGRVSQHKMKQYIEQLKRAAQ